MSCKWCGSSRHMDDNCPTLHLVQRLTGKPVTGNGKMPDVVGVMTEEEFFSKSETELHDEVVNIKKIRRVEP